MYRPRTPRLELTIASALAFLVAGSVVSGTVRQARAQDPPPAAAATRNDEAAKILAELKASIAKQDEAAARASVAKLVEIWKDKDVLAETKKPIPELLGRLAKEEKTPVEVAICAIDAMAELGAEEGGKALRDVLDRALRAKAPSADLYGACLRGMKKLADPSKATVEVLVGLLVRKENDLIAKAADAIAGYKDAPGKLRRDLMEEVLKHGESAFQGAQGNKDSAATVKWQTIGGGVMSALRALSGQQFTDPALARKWFNDHKKDPKIWS